MQLRYSFALAAATVALPGHAAELALKLDIPRLAVAEYHKPYVAIWVEKSDQTFATNLAVWYDLKMKNNEGTKWLKDMRAWWRKSGRDLTMPVDGLSSATRAPGEHSISFSSAKGPLASLPAGEYQVVIEAAREVGGREVIKIPFQWPAKAGAAAPAVTAKGEHELGAVSLTVKP